MHSVWCYKATRLWWSPRNMAVGPSRLWQDNLCQNWVLYWCILKGLKQMVGWLCRPVNSCARRSRLWLPLTSLKDLGWQMGCHWRSQRRTCRSQLCSVCSNLELPHWRTLLKAPSNHHWSHQEKIHCDSLPTKTCLNIFLKNILLFNIVMGFWVSLKLGVQKMGRRTFHSIIGAASLVPNKILASAKKIWSEITGQNHNPYHGVPRPRYG